MPVQTLEHTFTGPTTTLPAYDKTKTSIGNLIRQNSGAGELDKWVGPMPIAIARPMEMNVTIPGIFPFVIRKNATVDWVFLGDNATAATNRRITLFEFNRSTNAFTWIGSLQLTGPSGNATLRGLRVTLDRYTTGTITTNGSTSDVTGAGTDWKTSGMCVGNRIGFGTTDPEQVTEWFPIATIPDDTSLTVTGTPPAHAGVPFVIEDLRIISALTNSTTTNGGLFVTKGLRFELFTSGGTTIAMGTTVDNITAQYWLADASTVLNTVAGGVAIDERVSWTEQWAYVLDGTTSCRIYKYNLRAPLSSLASGKSTSAFAYRTGAVTVTGTASQSNNGRVGTLQHAPVNGEKSYYFVTTTRCYRVPLAQITNGSVNWHSGSMMVEIAPGSNLTHALSSAQACVEIADSIDRLIITTTGAAGQRSYVTRFNVNAEPYDHIFLIDSRQLDSSQADAGSVVHPSILALTMTPWAEAGILYLARMGTVATNNHVYTLPLEAHWRFAQEKGQVAITPVLTCPGSEVFLRVYVRDVKQLGSGTFGMPTEPWRMYYRTDNFDTATGGWVLLGDDLSLSGVGGTQIQFLLEFKILGTTCIPARVMSLSLLYQTPSELPTEFRWNLTDSDQNTAAVGFVQAASHSYTTLTVRYYRVDNDKELLSQASSGTTNGYFQYYDSGWVNGLGPNVVGTRRRFVPTAGLPASVPTYVYLEGA